MYYGISCILFDEGPRFLRCSNKPLTEHGQAFSAPSRESTVVLLGGSLMVTKIRATFSALVCGLSSMMMGRFPGTAMHCIAL